MSCEHGNHVEACDLCEALEAKYNSGFLAGQSSAEQRVKEWQEASLINERLRIELQAKCAEYEKRVNYLKEELDRELKIGTDYLRELNALKQRIRDYSDITSGCPDVLASRALLATMVPQTDLAAAEQRVKQLDDDFALYVSESRKIHDENNARIAELEREREAAALKMYDLVKQVRDLEQERDHWKAMEALHIHLESLKAQAGEPDDDDVDDGEWLTGCPRCGDSSNRCDCYDEDEDDDPSTPAAEQAIQDTLRYGVHATKDGKRIDPTDLYPAAEPKDIEHLRGLLGKANALCRIRQGRIKELVECIERMRVAGGSHEFQMAFELAKDAIGHGKDTSLTDIPKEEL